VVAFYNKGGTPNQWLSKEIRPLNLSAAEEKDLVAFMEALTGQIAPEVSTRLRRNCQNNPIKNRI
jgi:cytochrome c peroxidase